MALSGGICMVKFSPKNLFMNESNPSDDALAELLTLTVTVTMSSATIYRNHLGQRHRIHGPAVIRTNGDQEWRQNGQLHRTDGPAYVSPSYGRYWFLYGEPFTEKEHHDRLRTRYF